MFFPCPRSRLIIWSRETGPAVPSRVSSQIVHTQVRSQAESGAYSRDSSRFPRRRLFPYRLPPSGRSRVIRVTQWRTYGVLCRDSASTGPAALKGVPATGAAFPGFTMDQFLCASLFPHSLILLLCMQL